MPQTSNYYYLAALFLKEGDRYPIWLATRITMYCNVLPILHQFSPPLFCLSRNPAGLSSLCYRYRLIIPKAHIYRPFAPEFHQPDSVCVFPCNTEAYRPKNWIHLPSLRKTVYFQAFLKRSTALSSHYSKTVAYTFHDKAVDT